MFQIGATSDFVMENSILNVFLYKEEGFKTSEILSFKLYSMYVLERERPKLMNETDIAHHH
jgi:hypothetical protein